MAPTDVLSFETGTSWGEVDEELGDIFLCQEYIRAQAHRFHVSPKEEMIRMLVHGILHLLGYTHEKKKDADRMFSLQEQYVTQSLSVIT
jgi:probable rRNA maturation factor